VPRFFGLTPNDKDVFLEQVFVLIYHLGFTYQDAYSLPVWQRFWFINRLKEEFKQAKEKNSNPNSSARRTNSGSRQFKNLM
jgi:hypothetical protein